LPNSVKYKIFVAFLLHIGCKEVSQKSSHLKFKKEGCIRPIIVPKKDVVYPDVINSNLKTLGISYKQFLDTVGKL